MYRLDLAAATIGLAIILYVARRYAKRLFDGDIMLMYLIWYGWVRSFLEMYRVDNWFIGPLPTATWLGIAGIILAAAFLVVRHRRGWGTPGAWMHREQTDGGGTAEEGAPSASPSSEPSPG